MAARVNALAPIISSGSGTFGVVSFVTTKINNKVCEKLTINIII